MTNLRRIFIAVLFALAACSPGQSATPTSGPPITDPPEPVIEFDAEPIVTLAAGRLADAVAYVKAANAPPPTTTTTTTPPAPTTTEASAPAPASAPSGWTKWDQLAECEANGEWDYGPHSGWGSGRFQGGLQFLPSTWDNYKPAGYPAEAYQASREQQIVVAERVLAEHGWRAWPRCSRMLGWR